MLGLPRGTFQNCNRGRTPPRTDSAGTTPVRCPFRLASRIGSPTPAYICPRRNSDRASRQRDVRSLPATRRSLQREWQGSAWSGHVPYASPWRLQPPRQRDQSPGSGPLD